MAIFFLIVGILLFIGLIVIHEYGHFLAATRNGVEAEEFAIFFGPTIYKRVTKKGWIFRINSIPAGGYVKLKGEHDSDTGKDSYGAAKLWVKVKIMLAGVVTNLVAGVLMLTLLSLIGMPQVIPNQFNIAKHSTVINHGTSTVSINEIVPGSPASRSVLKNGDKILFIGTNGKLIAINSQDDLHRVTKEFAGQQVTIKYSRNNIDYQTRLMLNSESEVKNTNQKVYLGVVIKETPNSVTLIRNTWNAPLVALGLTKQITVLTFQGLGNVLKGIVGIFAGAFSGNHAARQSAQTSASNQVVGPVGIYTVLKDGSAIGIQFTLFIVALISLSLGLVNLLPIPGLDGGRLWLTLFFRLIRKPLTQKTEEVINGAGFVLLISLLILLTVLDIKRFY